MHIMSRKQTHVHVCFLFILSRMAQYQYSIERKEKITMRDSLYGCSQKQIRFENEDIPYRRIVGIHAMMIHIIFSITPMGISQMPYNQLYKEATVLSVGVLFMCIYTKHNVLYSCKYFSFDFNYIY